MTHNTCSCKHLQTPRTPLLSFRSSRSRDQSSPRPIVVSGAYRYRRGRRRETGHLRDRLVVTDTESLRDDTFGRSPGVRGVCNLSVDPIEFRLPVRLACEARGLAVESQTACGSVARDRACLALGHKTGLPVGVCEPILGTRVYYREGLPDRHGRGRLPEGRAI